QLQHEIDHQAATQLNSSGYRFKVAARDLRLHVVDAFTQISDLELAAVVGVESGKNGLLGLQSDSRISLCCKSGRKRNAPANHRIVSVRIFVLGLYVLGLSSRTQDEAAKKHKMHNAFHRSHCASCAFLRQLSGKA